MDEPHYWIGSDSPYVKERAKWVKITDKTDLIAYYLCDPGFRGHFCGSGSNMVRYDYRKQAKRLLEKFNIELKENNV